MAIPDLFFVDSNIWLDFHRVRNAEALTERLIVAYQMENEYKRNHQAAVFEGMQELKAPQEIPRPVIFSDAAAQEEAREAEPVSSVKALSLTMTDVSELLAFIKRKSLAELLSISLTHPTSDVAKNRNSGETAIR